MVEQSALRFLTATNTPMGAEKHYVTIFLLAQVPHDAVPIVGSISLLLGDRAADRIGSAQVTEPEKCEKWEWISWTQLRERAQAVQGAKLFGPLLDLLLQRPDISLAR